ncbi:MAG: hypothetical protein KDK45_12445, partial [Leptospiraceae bacterium]|nr:hypothetical protein [Leptospiraceae bacterium]
MKKTNKTRYNLDIQSFRKRILFSSSLTFILYASILTWAYTRIEPESTQKFFFISACVIGIISFFLFKKYTNQLRILKNTYIEIEGKVLRQYTINNICTEIDLKGVSGLQRDSFRGYPRLLLLTPEGNFSLINPVQIEKLQVELEQIIGKKTAARIFKGKEILTKAIFFFSPSVIIGFVYLFQT